ncbi:MAG: DUF89 family protein [Candidatus Delongbacteria bacterium]|nr:DUF89 family protein [Candidatus Delongbacteria bacterium]MBN2835108.1 DUF89 family protein [Candidatus Delongbacteria bacterium]
MKIAMECVPCFLKQTVSSLKMITLEEHDQEIVLREVLELASKIDFELSPPEFGQMIHKLIREKTNSTDPYKKLKVLANQRAKELYKVIQPRVMKATNPFYMAIKFAIAANIMDFGVFSDWNEANVIESFNKAKSKEICGKICDRLYKKISLAKNVLVLGDNAGEVVFDKLLIETFPGNAKIYYAVKGSPVINDVTIDDAYDAGIGEVAEIISNGTDIPGTVFEKCSSQFRNIFNSVDLIVSKGQGNFETLHDRNKKIYFMLQIKCRAIADKYGYNVGDWKLVNH